MQSSVASTERAVKPKNALMLANALRETLAMNFLDAKAETVKETM
jgi:hypothetical protein